MTKEFLYTPQGVCSRQIKIVLEDDIVKSIQFVGGCPGNTQGVAKLAVGRNVDDLITILSGTRCGMKNTSCPDQLAKALLQTKNS